jgi:hypothetical protein
MKNLKPVLYVLAVLCLISLLVPSTMLAQDDGEGPCCYGHTNRSMQTSGIDDQSLIILFDILIETSISQWMFDTGGGGAEIVDGSQQIPLMLPKDNLQPVSLHRMDYLMV